MGLLAKATLIREQWEQEEAIKRDQEARAKLLQQPEAKTVRVKRVLQHRLHTLKVTFKNKTKNFHRPKLRKLAAGLFIMGLSFQNIDPAVVDARNSVTLEQLWNTPAIEFQAIQPESIEIKNFINNFANVLTQSSVSEQDRDDLARMLYGEAGRGVDAIEVLHTVLNRKASPLFKGTMHDIITAKNQYIGFKTTHPVDRKLRAMVDYVVDEWEANGCKPIDDCDRYYFVTGKPGINNKFEVSAKNSQGRWVSYAKKNYDKPGHYCDKAYEQYAKFNQTYNYRLAQHHVNGHSRSI